jgi:hypothetical protein
MLKCRLYHAVCALVTLAIVGCGGSSSDSSDEVDPQLAGSSIDPVDVAFADNGASLSADGQRVVFVTGRESTPDAPVLKVYKADWPAGAAPGAAARLTASDIGNERWAAVSPDGAWVAIVAVSSTGQVDLYLQEYAGKQLVKLTDDAAIESRVAFDPQSKVLAWLSRAADGTTTVKLTDVGVGGGADGAAKCQDASLCPPGSADGEGPIDLAFLPSTGGSYVLATALPAAATSAKRVDWVTRSFSTIADAAGAKKTEWAKGHLIDLDVPLVAAGATALITDRLVPTGGTDASRIAIYSGAAGDAPPSTYAIADPQFAAIADGKLTPFPTVPGYDTLATQLTADGTAAFMLMRNAYRCDVAAAATYGTFIVTTPADAAGVSGYYTPLVAGPDGGFDAITDICATTRADGSVGVIDDRLSELKVNGAASLTQFRALYVSRFSTAFAGTDCTHRNGDTEVYGLDVKDGAQKIYSVSNNLATLESLNGETACSL